MNKLIITKGICPEFGKKVIGDNADVANIYFIQVGVE